MIIQSKRVFINKEFINAQLVIENGKIVKISEYNQETPNVDFKNAKIIPGLIDIHCHGYQGMDSNYATKDGLTKWAYDLALEGCTSFLVTTSTAPEKNLLESFSLIAQTIDQKIPGANMLGIHVEGPQISFPFKGAHNPYLIQKPNIEQFNRYQEAAQGKIKMICIAPECDTNHDLIRYCSGNNIRVAIGHSGASYNECVVAMNDGASSFTHTFNGMTGLHHREPGCVGASMSLDSMYSELICDGVHVHYAACKALARCKGEDKLILITDAVQIKGLKPGLYHMPGRDVEIGQDGCGRLPDGTLAGSSNKLMNCVKNLINECDIDESIAIRSATYNPAKFLGIENKKGLIEENYDADLVVIDDDFKVITTFVEGSELCQK